MKMWLARIRREDESIPASPTVEAPPKSAEALYYDVAMMRLQTQLAQVDVIDAKAAPMLAIGSTILPITASLLTNEQALIANHVMSKWALIAAGGFYVLLIGAFVSSYRLSQWDARPELEQWRDEVTPGRSEEEVHRWLGDACVEAYLLNKPQVERKAKLVAATLILLALEAASLTVAVLAPIV